MKRKYLKGGLALALPLAGLVAYGGSQFAVAAGAPSLNCNAGAVSQFDSGTGFTSGVPGLFVDDGPAAKIYDLAGESVGSTTLTVKTPVNALTQALEMLPVALGQPLTLPDHQIVYVTNMETNQYYPSVPATEAILTISAADTHAVVAGALITVDATDGTHGTTKYNATEDRSLIQLFGSGCTAPTKEFYPTTLQSPPTELAGSTSNAFVGLEAKSQTVLFDIGYPSDPSGVYGTGTPATPDYIAFGAGHGTFNASNGFFVYNLGKVTGPFATAAATATLGLDGAIICTANELTALAGNSSLNPLVVCDGGSGTSVTQLATLTKLLDVEEYYGTAGACLTYVAPATPCNPYGSDGSLLTEAVQLDLGGSASL